MATAVSSDWTRIRTLGRGTSGAVVSLAADAASGRLFAVKSAADVAASALLQREHSILSKLRSPHIVSCLGFRDAAGDGSCHLLLEFAPGGSLSDTVKNNGGRLEERVIRSYAADVLRGLAYLHANSLVHGDVKGQNVLIGADGRAKIADFGCARERNSSKPIGGTPAFMAPEVARGEEQGPAADVWALGCTVIEMATGRAPWAGIDDLITAIHKIGYTEAVPEMPKSLSEEAKDFLDRCLRGDPRDRWTAEQLLLHPFVALDGCVAMPEQRKHEWVSPKSTLDLAFWESDIDEDASVPGTASVPEIPAAERMRALACPVSAVPDWDSDDGWIEVRRRNHLEECSPASRAEVMSGVGVGVVTSEGLDREAALFRVDEDGGVLVHINVEVVDGSIKQGRDFFYVNLNGDDFSCSLVCNQNEAMEFDLFDLRSQFASVFTCFAFSATRLGLFLGL